MRSFLRPTFTTVYVPHSSWFLLSATHTHWMSDHTPLQSSYTFFFGGGGWGITVPSLVPQAMLEREMEWVALVFKNRFEVWMISAVSHSSSVQCVKIDSDTIPMMCAIIYRRPQSDKDFITAFSEFLLHYVSLYIIYCFYEILTFTYLVQVDPWLTSSVTSWTLLVLSSRLIRPHSWPCIVIQFFCWQH